MDRDLSLSTRIEEQRSKIEVKQNIVEFKLEEIKSHFDENIINIEQNIKKSYELIGSYTSFLFKKTIYKVKKGDK